MIRKVSLLAIVVAAWCAAAAPAAAQVTGSITGTVKDAQGGVIPGATVVLIDESRATKSAPAITNASGDFTFPNTPASTYTIEVTMSGFKTVRRPGVQVSGGDRLSVGVLTIDVGGRTEVVEVTAEAPLVQSQSGERSYTVTTEAVQGLPIASRSYIELAALAPGVALGVPDPNAAAGVGAFFPPMRLGGGSGVNDTITLDGAGVIDTGGANIRLAPNVDAISEVKVVVAAGQAEFGRGSGIQIAGVTKSGTNRFRGSVYDVERNSDWNANSWLNEQRKLPKTLQKERDFGYTLGGPVGKPGGTNKLFFFFSDEWRPRTAGGETFYYRVPTELERKGDFSQSRDNNGALFPYIRDYTLNQPCSAANTAGCFAYQGVLGRIDPARLYQVGLNILNQWPLPNNGDNYTGQNSYNYVNVNPERSGYLVQHSLRFDHQLSPNLRLNGKMVYETKSKVVNSPNIAFGQATNHLNGYNDALETQPAQFQYTASGNYNINSMTFLEATWGMFQNQTGSPTVSPLPAIGDFPLLFPDSKVIDPRFHLYNRLKNDAPPWITTNASGALIANLPPTFAFGSLVANAPPPYPGWNCCININTVNNVTVSVTRIQGHHTMKAGFWFEHSFKEQTSGSFKPNVSFAQGAGNTYDSQFGFSNAALGVFSSYSQSSRFLASGFKADNRDFYLQDNWKVNQKLTLDYGLRFVHQVPGHDGYGLASNFIASEYDASKAPVLYRPICAPGVAAPCTGNNLRAINPQTGEILAAGSSSLVGTKVPNTAGNNPGLFLAGTGPVPESTYLLPDIVYGPRFGVAYDVTGKQAFVVRGGAGVYYDRPFGTAGPIGQPPTAVSSTLTNDLLTNVRPGAGTSSTLSVSNITANQLHSKIATSVQYNAGVQMALPYSLVLDLAYAGSYNFNESAAADINGLTFGALYLPQNQDPTKAPAASTGANTYATNLIRPLLGYGAINQQQFVNWNRFDSLQTALNRRFKNGLQFNFNYTFSRNYGTDGQGVRVDPDGKGGVVLRADHEQLATRVSAGANGSGSSDQPHVARVNFVWDLPDVRGESPSLRTVGYVLNDWQLSGVWNIASGVPYSLSYTYQASGSPSGNQLTGSPNYVARIIMNGDTGSGCSSDPTRQFKVDGLAGPQFNSLGLESKNNTLRGCTTKKMDLAVARLIKLGGNRTAQIRIEAYNIFNTVNYTNRVTSVTFASVTQNTSIVNLPYDASGAPIGTRAVPGGTGAGLGVVSAAGAMRAFQAQLRFTF